VRILAIGAHPDDVELLSGGTLSLCASRGDDVYMAHLTVGDKGGSQDPKELAATRRAEAAAAAAIIGATPLFGFTGDLELYDQREFRDLIGDFIRTARPDLIIAPAPNCYHTDHRIASRLVFDAAYSATLPNYPSPAGMQPHPVRAPIYYMDTVGGIDFTPEEFVDITPAWDAKQRMLECHTSQIRWLKGFRGSDLVAMAETLSRARGIQVGVRMAEGFRLEKVYGRIRPSRLLP